MHVSRSYAPALCCGGGPHHCLYADESTLSEPCWGKVQMTGADDPESGSVTPLHVCMGHLGLGLDARVPKYSREPVPPEVGPKLDVIAAGLWKAPDDPPAVGELVVVEVGELWEGEWKPNHKGRWDGSEELTVDLGTLTKDGWWVKGRGYMPFYGRKARIRRWAALNLGD